MKKLLLMTLTMCIAVVCSAQDYAEYYRFAENAKENSLLFRGKNATVYDFAYNGTYYLESPEYKSGDVYYNGKLYRDVLMNLNAHKQVLLVKQSANMSPVATTTEAVGWFNIDGAMFVNFTGKGLDLPSGFMRVIHEGKACLYKHTLKLYHKNTSGSDAANSVNSAERAKAYLPSFVEATTCYLIREDGTIETFKEKKSSLNTLIGRFPDRKKELKQFAKAGYLYSKPFDEAAATIMKHVNDED